MLELLFLGLFFFFAVFLSFVLFFVSFIFVSRTIDFEKQTAYECGFNPFGDARGRFDIKFYLVAILFIVFDIEVVFLYPWVYSVYFLPFFTFYIILFFFFFILLGFFYEWKKGVLVW